MQPVIESLTGLKRRTVLKVPTLDVEKELKKELASISRTTKIPGFRPGKAPVEIVKRTYGSTVRQDVVSKIVGNLFNTLVKENNLSVVGFPNIAPEGSDDLENNLSFVAEFEVYPEIVIPEFNELEIKSYNSSVSDENIKNTIEILRKQKVRFEKREDYKANINDKVVISFVGNIDGSPFEGGSSNSSSFILGSKQLLQDFEESLIGMKSGESKVFKVQFPDDYHDSKVAGKIAEFSVKIIEVYEGILPSLDNEFAKSFSNESDFNLEKLEKNVRATIEREVEVRVKNLNKESVINFFLNNIEFDVPEILVKHEAAMRFDKLRERIKSQGGKDGDIEKLSLDILFEDSKRMVKLGLIISEIAKINNLYPKEEQVLDYLTSFSKNYENPDQFINNYMLDKHKKSEVESLILENNVVDHVLNKAKIIQDEVKFEKLMGLE